MVKKQKSRQITIIPKPELRLFREDSPTKLPCWGNSLTGRWFGKNDVESEGLAWDSRSKNKIPVGHCCEMDPCEEKNSKNKREILFWLVVEPTHLKNISQIGNLPQRGVKIKNI